MAQYAVTLIEGGEEDICFTCATLKEAKRYIADIQYFPEYRRTPEYLEISEDGMQGVGNDGSSTFTYKIKSV